ncbi:phospholipase D family protein [Bradyrhizobium sp. SZCCHNS3052]|uniref:phospholipase D family protein n=1 Tax=Bradyrhizobium sp. SZCCHNS3052 TaxID=3057321 RepID=UPI002916A0A6|nr:phospholipase D family protein [Bradyrhizobium sp. SZCCHNS3052]
MAILSTLAGHSLSGEDAALPGIEDGFRIMRDIETLSSRVRVLLNVGGFRASSFRMAAPLDAIVREIVPPDRQCSFHPKLLIFEYDTDDRQQRTVASDIRMFVCTRNVTTDDSVDAIVSLRLIERNEVTENGKRLRGFLQAALDEVGEDVPAELSRLLKRLDHVDLEPLHGAPSLQGIEFHGQIPGKEALSSLISRSADGVEERIVVSPFIDKTTLREFALGGQRRTCLLSEPREIARICALDAGDAFLRENFECYELRRDLDQSFHSLHAKLVLDRTASATVVTVGSANATLRAWRGKNWEAVIRFQARQGYYNQVFDDLFVDDRAKNGVALCVRIVPVPEGPAPESAKEAVANLIARAALDCTISCHDAASVTVDLSMIPGDSEFELKRVSFRLFGEMVDHQACPEMDAWRLSWSVPVARFSAFLSIAATFMTGSGEDEIRVNRRLDVDPALLARRNHGLLSELVQGRGVHEILAAILEGTDLGFSPDFGGDAGSSWTVKGGAGVSVASLEALVFLCLNDDPESLAKRSMISDVMKAEFAESPPGTDAEKIDRHRRLFEAVKKIWAELDRQFPVKARDPWGA